jgi:cyclin-dependent kinase 7
MSSRSVLSTPLLRPLTNLQLLDVFSSKSNLNLVLEFLDTDLEAVIKDRSLIFQASDIKSWMLMTMRGLEFCHRNWVLHRVGSPERICLQSESAQDMKPNNLLIAPDGRLKIADFGLAREFGDPKVPMSHQVVTRWYRAPELLFAAQSYHTGVDVWAAGCIFAELLLRVPYLAGDNDMDQLNKIFSALGTPTEEEWPVSVSQNRTTDLTAAQNHTRLPGYLKFDKKPKQPLNRLFTAASAEALDWLAKTLTFDPMKRITAKEVCRLRQTRDPTDHRTSL